MEELKKLKSNLGLVIKGKNEVVDLVVCALCAGGNVLMDDVPGVGKTTLAKALASSIHGRFQRVQFTPDLLPSDITGISIFNPKNAEFHFRKGPIFANVFLADEINRASPRTQSALLEAMNEGQVTVEGKTYPLPKPFLVIATQNPIEYQGTYPLPEAQLDRFAIQLEIGYPDAEAETEIMRSRRGVDPLDALKPVIDTDAISAAQKKISVIEVERSVEAYIVQIVRATREDIRIRLGASPRALLSLTRCSQAKAFLDGRDFVTPDDVRKMAPHVLSHRIILDNKVKYSGAKKKEIFESVLSKIAVPL
ncbi:MAG: MoxR family ATPase [Kiritimatiellaeota bacterium]|nr:MoxR family ATPase [Kiritimatiellota bacterium]